MHKDTIENIMINAISVNNLDSSSGIFVGINNANNWSSHRKNNIGLGPVDSSQVMQNINLLIDNNFIDMPFDNSVVIKPPERKDLYSCYGNAAAIVRPEMTGEGHSGPMQEINTIDVSEIDVISMDTNATVSIGENSTNVWSAHSKRNEGTGRSTGISQYKLNTNIVIDNDFIDAQINDNDIIDTPIHDHVIL